MKKFTFYNIYIKTLELKKNDYINMIYLHSTIFILKLIQLQSQQGVLDIYILQYLY